MSTRQFIENQRRWVRWFVLIWPFWCALIIGINIWHDASAGLPFNWQNFALGVALVLFGGVVFLFCELIFRVVLAAVSDEGGDR